MKFAVVASAALLMFLECLLATQASGQKVQRDAHALAVIENSLSAAGGSELLSAVRDYTATGEITYYWDPQVTGSLTLRAKGKSQFRMDVAFPNTARTVIADGEGGSITEIDGNVQLMSPEAAKALDVMAFPYKLLLNAIGDESMELTYKGVGNHLGKQAYEITIQQVDLGNSNKRAPLAKGPARDVFIDVNTSLVLSILNVVGSAGIPHELVFANYQTVNALLIPLWVTESVGNQSLLTLRLSHVMFNTGVNDSTFTR